jgi:hypothetical protein
MRVTFLLLLVAALLLPATALAQVPKGVIAEDATATWCVYCPAAYAGLEVMKNRYDATEFNAIRYYSSSGGGGLATTETDARNNYYGVTGFPTVNFDGGNAVVGGGTVVQSGDAYNPIVAREIGVPSPISIHINSISFAQPTGSVNLDVRVEEAIPDISNMKIRIVVLENNVTYNSETYTDVTRDVLTDVPLSVSMVGQVQNVQQSFSVSGTWKPADLWAAAFVQNDTNKEIIQGVSTRTAPAYSLRYWAKGSRAVVAPWSAPYHFQDFAVFNMGTNPDNITATVNNIHLPAGWSAVFTDGVNDYTTRTLALNPGEHQTFHVRITPASPGYATVNIDLTSINLPGKTRSIGYQLVTGGVPVLLVDDDGAATFENYYIDALTNYGVSYGLWDTNNGNLTAADLSHFPVVIWQMGLSYPTLTASDRAALGTYLEHGGKLFINGQDFGWEMDDQGGVALDWYHNYLHANFILDDTNQYTLNGTAGDPISNGIVLTIQGGDGANNQEYPDAIAARDAAATPIFTYGTSTYKGGIRVDTGTYKVVYLGFGYEAISTAANRRLLMARILQWFNMAPSDVQPQDLASSRVMVNAFPNPAREGSTLRLSLPSAGPAHLGIYALDGSLVRTLVNGNRPAGNQDFMWDGRDDAGRALPSGVYFYRLQTGGADQPTGKLILTR